MNPFHRKSPLEKLGDSLGDAVKRIPRALESVPRPGRSGVAALGGLAGLAAGSAALSSRRRKSEPPEGDA
jgi:hypothetical protein